MTDPTKHLWRSILLVGVFLSSVLSISAQGLHAEPHSGNRFTERSFLLLWPGQSKEAARLDLNSPLITDRPNFTEASRTVGKNVTQIEVGYTFSYDGATTPKRSSHAYPEASLRHGTFADWLELRLSQSFISNNNPGESGTELGTTYVGAKLGLVPQHGAFPEISLVPSTLLPSGSGSARSDRALPGMNLAYSWALSGASFLSGTTKFYRSLGDSTNDSLSTSAQSAVLGARITPDLTGYVEWYGVFQDERSGDAVLHFADSGFTWLYTSEIQYDLRFGSRLQGRFGEDIFLGLGVSRRFL